VNEQVEEMALRSSPILLFMVTQMLHKLPMDLTSKDLFLHMQSDSCDVSGFLVSVTQVVESWTNGRQTSLQVSGISLSTIPEA